MPGIVLQARNTMLKNLDIQTQSVSFIPVWETQTQKVNKQIIVQIEIRNSKKQRSEKTNERREVSTICKQCSGQAFLKMLYLSSYLRVVAGERLTKESSLAEITAFTEPLGLPLWLSWWRSHLQCRRPGFDPWVGKIPWRSQRLPTLVLWPGEFHGLYSPGDHKESDTTERLSISLSPCGAEKHVGGTSVATSWWAIIEEHR